MGMSIRLTIGFSKCALVVAILIFAIVALGTRVQAVNPPTGMRLVAENDYLALYIKDSTAEIAVIDKAGDTIWFSNPPNRSRMETIARGRAKNALGAQLSLVYYTPQDLRKEVDSYNDSVAYGQYEIVPIENGVRVEFSFGEKWQDEDYLPIMISKERFESLILANITRKSDRELLLDNYSLISLRPSQRQRTDKSEEGFAEKLFGDYVFTLHEAFTGEIIESSEHILVDQVVSRFIGKREDIQSRTQLKREYFNPLMESPSYVLKAFITKWDLEEIMEVIKDSGYTPEEVQIDHIAHNIDPPKDNIEVFFVPIEYTLEGDNLVVRVPTSDIEFPWNVVASDGDRVSFPLTTLSVLDFFGAADKGQSGYIFVPDGSGALIELNNGKTSVPSYLQQVYGDDLSVSLRQERLSIREQAYLPVFGMKQGDQAFLAVIESGDAIARIKASVAGKTDSYNKVSAEFVVMPRAETALKGDISGKFSVTNMKVRTKMNVYQSRLCESDVKIRYSFLGGENANYVGMAKSYREYLEERGVLTRRTADGDIPLFLEVVGSVAVQKPVMGIPREVVVPLTTYEQTASIVKNLMDLGVGNMLLRYSGWMQGGIEHVFPKGVKLEKAVGARDDLIRLSNFLRTRGVAFFPDVGFLSVYRNTLIDGFTALTDSARFLDRNVAKVYAYDPATQQYDSSTEYFVLSPSRLGSLVDRFLSDYVDYGIGGISLGSMGLEINSDFREDPDKLVDREQSKAIMQEQLWKFDRDAGLDVMVSGGNAIALPYTSAIVEMPMGSSDALIIDYTIPFYQIVVHGFVAYAGEPLNFAADYLGQTLKMIETGGYPYFRVSAADPSVLKGTRFQHLYALDYDDWRQSIVDFYSAANEVLRGVQDQLIVNHERLAAGVYKTTYENGTSIVVNYTADEYILDGLTVQSFGYAVVE